MTKEEHLKQAKKSTKYGWAITNGINYASDEAALKAMEEYAQQAISEHEVKILHNFIDWHNEKQPEKYIPNSEIGQYLNEP